MQDVISTPKKIQNATIQRLEEIAAIPGAFVQSTKIKVDNSLKQFTDEINAAKEKSLSIIPKLSGLSTTNTSITSTKSGDVIKPQKVNTITVTLQESNYGIEENKKLVTTTSTTDSLKTSSKYLTSDKSAIPSSCTDTNKIKSANNLPKFNLFPGGKLFKPDGSLQKDRVDNPISDEVDEKDVIRAVGAIAAIKRKQDSLIKDEPLQNNAQKVSTPDKTNDSKLKLEANGASQSRPLTSEVEWKDSIGAIFGGISNFRFGVATRNTSGDFQVANSFSLTFPDKNQADGTNSSSTPKEVKASVQSLFNFNFNAKLDSAKDVTRTTKTVSQIPKSVAISTPVKSITDSKSTAPTASWFGKSASSSSSTSSSSAASIKKPDATKPVDIAKPSTKSSPIISSTPTTSDSKTAASTKNGKSRGLLNLSFGSINKINGEQSQVPAATASKTASSSNSIATPPKLLTSTAVMNLKQIKMFDADIITIDKALQSFDSGNVNVESLYSTVLNVTKDRDSTYQIMPYLIGSLPRGPRKTALNSFYQQQS
jgi:hypothetical protein